MDKEFYFYNCCLEGRQLELGETDVTRDCPLSLSKYNLYLCNVIPWIDYPGRIPRGQDFMTPP